MCPITVLLLFVLVEVQANPEITSYDKVVTLKENVLTNTALSTIVCSDPDGDATRTYVRSVQPGSPCQNCFTVLDCGAAECLQYRSGVGRLNHDVANLYLITVSCEDPSRNSATEVIQVVIIPNEPPKFNPDTLSDEFSDVNAATSPGDKIGDVKAEDADGDLLSYSMSVIPSSAYTAFSIQSDGSVVANVDLRTLCRSYVTLKVTVTDGYNTVGPKVVAVSFTNNYVKPVAINLNREIQVTEDTTGQFYTYLFVPADDLTYTVTSTTAAAFAQFTSTDEKLEVASTLNYEDNKLRVTDLDISVNAGGFCESDTYSLRITVTDVNEAPVISDKVTSVEVCEGKIEFVPPFTWTDEDEEDTHTWTFINADKDNDEGLYFVDPDTGLLGTTFDYDVDPDYNKPKRYSRKYSYKIQVTDKGGLSATATVSASFLDCNDNAPRFVKAFFTYQASECTGPGSVLGTLRADDADSKREGNNEITFSGASGAVSVGDTGNVILTKALSAGTVVVFDVYAQDQGLTPGPLRSEQPAKVSVIFGVCPTPSDDSSNSDSADSTEAASNLGANLPWIIIAAILGAILLTLVTFMLWRYWEVMGEACSRLNCSRSCQGRRGRPRLPNNGPSNQNPSNKPSQAPTPEKEKGPPPPSFLMGFWKERFPDDDHKVQPDRRTLPTPADMNQHDTNTYDPVQPPAQNATPPETPKKRCTIL